MLTGMSDTSLVKLAQAGNGEAFGMLFQQYKMEIFGYLRGRLGNAEEAYDLTQRTFLKAWQKLPQLHDVSKFKPWLYTIARNEANDWWQSKVKTPLESLEQLEEQHVLVSKPGPEDEVAETELVMLALAELSPKYRDCLLLQIEGGLTLSEIAGMLGITQESATTYASNARRQFRQAYRRLKGELNIAIEGSILVERRLKP